MAHSYNNLDQSDVLSELLDICDLRLLTLENNVQRPRGFLFKTQRKSVSMRIDFYSNLVHITWSVAHADLHPFFENLPRLHKWKEAGGISLFLEMLSCELEIQRPGTQFIAERLACACFVAIIRDLSQSLPTYRSPLRSPSIAKAIQFMHAKPEHPWTIPDLASRVSESRSSFNRKFLEAVGIAPHQYLRNWRIILAQKRLLSENISLDLLAFELGFSGQSSLSRAFKEVVGLSPTRWLAQSHRA